MSDQVTPPANTAPWAADLQAAFTDPAQAALVDQFLRERVQPHVTQLETKLSGLKQAQELYDDLQADPGQTYVALTNELFGEDRANEIVALLTKGDVEGAAAAIEEADGEKPPVAPALDPEDREVLDAAKRQRAQERYDAAVADYVAEHGDIVPKYFHTHVAAAAGDFDKAYASYQSWKADVVANPELFGFAPDATAIVPEAVVDNVAPPTIGGGDAAAVTSPPIQKTYGSLDEALDDFMAEQKAGPPPTVGSV